MSATVTAIAFKDFAAPIATVIAAAAATFVTLSIQRQNYLLAERRLKMDLFDKRYRVYAGARDLLITLIHNPDVDEPETKNSISEYFLRLNESVFVSDGTARAFCDELRAVYQNWLSARFSTRNAQLYTPEERVLNAKNWTDQASNVMRMLDRVNAAFRADLLLSDTYVRQRR